MVNPRLPGTGSDEPMTLSATYLFSQWSRATAHVRRAAPGRVTHVGGGSVLPAEQILCGICGICGSFRCDDHVNRLARRAC
jgi:hypothetical protein